MSIFRLSCLALVASAATFSSAQIYNLNYNTRITGSTQLLSQPVATATITQLNANAVKFRIQLSSSLPAGSFVRTVWFNSASFTSAQVTGLNTFTSVTHTPSGDNAAAGYSFNGTGALPNGGQARLTGGEFAEFTIEKTGLLASSFLATSAGNGPRLISMLHLQGLSGNPDSAHYGVVPEPASMMALGAGALALIRRRRKNK